MDILTVQLHLTSPVAYLTSRIPAGFWDQHDRYYGQGTSYGNNVISLVGMIPMGTINRKWYNDAYSVLNTPEGTTMASGPWIYETNFRVYSPASEFLMGSQGPSGGNAYAPYPSPPGYGYTWISYDPSNGTVSRGNVMRYDGGRIQGPGNS